MERNDFYKVIESDDRVEVEWSPYGEKNCRVRRVTEWVYFNCKDARDAESSGKAKLQEHEVTSKRIGW